ncbi:hypothetical protein FACS1894217_01590 [Clostridia bacterium]|nr:hypothetical protein FACS1894217_01590 [Clostridia bacterium]
MNNAKIRILLVSLAIITLFSACAGKEPFVPYFPGYEPGYKPDWYLEAPPNVTITINGIDMPYELERTGWNGQPGYDEIPFTKLIKNRKFSKLRVLRSNTQVFSTDSVVTVKFDSNTPHGAGAVLKMLDHTGEDMSSDLLDSKLEGDTLTFNLNSKESEEYREEDPTLCGVIVGCIWGKDGKIDEEEDDFDNVAYQCSYRFLIRIQFAK